MTSEPNDFVFKRKLSELSREVTQGMWLGKEWDKQRNDNWSTSASCQRCPRVQSFYFKQALRRQSEIDGAERDIYVVESGDDFIDQFHSGSPQRVVNSVIHVT